MAAEAPGRAEVAGLDQGGMELAGGDLAVGRGHGGVDDQPADPGADVAEREAVAQWEALLATAAAAAREQEQQERERVRQAREQERQWEWEQEQEQDEDLEWEP